MSINYIFEKIYSPLPPYTLKRPQLDESDVYPINIQICDHYKCEHLETPLVKPRIEKLLKILFVTNEQIYLKTFIPPKFTIGEMDFLHVFYILNMDIGDTVAYSVYNETWLRFGNKINLKFYTLTNECDTLWSNHFDLSELARVKKHYIVPIIDGIKTLEILSQVQPLFDSISLVNNFIVCKNRNSFMLLNNELVKSCCVSAYFDWYNLTQKRIYRYTKKIVGKPENFKLLYDFWNDYMATYNSAYAGTSGYQGTLPSSPVYQGTLQYSPSSPAYKGTLPSSPAYEPSSPQYSPTSPAYEAYEPTSPQYNQSSNRYSPTLTPYNPTSPVYEPSSPVPSASEDP